jgi:hypothetical protein
MTTPERPGERPLVGSNLIYKEIGQYRKEGYCFLLMDMIDIKIDIYSCAYVPQSSEK